VLIAQWQGDELKFVYPTDEFEGVSELLYPKPEW
jgi:branched-chain amino acid transport system substrate-binding protein